MMIKINKLTLFFAALAFVPAYTVAMEPDEIPIHCNLEAFCYANYPEQKYELYKTAIYNLTNKDFQEQARDILMRLVENEFPPALFQVALLKRNHYCGFNDEDGESRNYLLKSAVKGFPLAQEQLGLYFLHSAFSLQQAPLNGPMYYFQHLGDPATPGQLINLHEKLLYLHQMHVPHTAETAQPAQPAQPLSPKQPQPQRKKQQKKTQPAVTIFKTPTTNIQEDNAPEKDNIPETLQNQSLHQLKADNAYIMGDEETPQQKEHQVQKPKPTKEEIMEDLRQRALGEERDSAALLELLKITTRQESLDIPLQKELLARLVGKCTARQFKKFQHEVLPLIKTHLHNSFDPELAYLAARCIITSGQAKAETKNYAQQLLRQAGKTSPEACWYLLSILLETNTKEGINYFAAMCDKALPETVSEYACMYQEEALKKLNALANNNGKVAFDLHVFYQKNYEATRKEEFQEKAQEYWKAAINQSYVPALQQEATSLLQRNQDKEARSRAAAYLTKTLETSSVKTRPMLLEQLYAINLEDCPEMLYQLAVTLLALDCKKAMTYLIQAENFAKQHGTQEDQKLIVTSGAYEKLAKAAKTNKYVANSLAALHFIRAQNGNFIKQSNAEELLAAYEFAKKGESNATSTSNVHGLEYRIALEYNQTQNWQKMAEFLKKSMQHLPIAKLAYVNLIMQHHAQLMIKEPQNLAKQLLGEIIDTIQAPREIVQHARITLIKVYQIDLAHLMEHTPEYFAIKTNIIELIRTAGDDQPAALQDLITSTRERWNYFDIQEAEEELLERTHEGDTHSQHLLALQYLYAQELDKAYTLWQDLVKVVKANNPIYSFYLAFTTFLQNPNKPLDEQSTRSVVNALRFLYREEIYGNPITKNNAMKNMYTEVQFCLGKCAEQQSELLYDLAWAQLKEAIYTKNVSEKALDLLVAAENESEVQKTSSDLIIKTGVYGVLHEAYNVTQAKELAFHLANINLNRYMQDRTFFENPTDHLHEAIKWYAIIHKSGISPTKLSRFVKERLAHAYCLLAWCHVDKDEKEQAFKLVQKALDYNENYPDGLYLIGSLYGQAPHVTDLTGVAAHQAAITYLTRVCNDNIDARYELGREYLLDPTTKEYGESLINKAAQLGNKQAIEYVAESYLFREPTNPDKALEIIKKLPKDQRPEKAKFIKGTAYFLKMLEMVDRIKANKQTALTPQKLLNPEIKRLKTKACKNLQGVTGGEGYSYTCLFIAKIRLIEGLPEKVVKILTAYLDLEGWRNDSFRYLKKLGIVSGLKSYAETNVNAARVIAKILFAHAYYKINHEEIDHIFSEATQYQNLVLKLSENTDALAYLSLGALKMDHRVLSKLNVAQQCVNLKLAKMLIDKAIALQGIEQHTNVLAQLFKQWQQDLPLEEAHQKEIADWMEEIKQKLQGKNITLDAQ